MTLSSIENHLAKKAIVMSIHIQHINKTHTNNVVRFGFNQKHKAADHEAITQLLQRVVAGTQVDFQFVNDNGSTLNLPIVIGSTPKNSSECLSALLNTFDGQYTLSIQYTDTDGNRWRYL